MVSYNTSELTRKSIEALLESKGVNLEIVVIDNASTDRSPVSLARKYRVRKNHDWLTQVGLLQQDEKAKALFKEVEKDADLVLNVRSTTQGNHQLHLVELRQNIGFGRATIWRRPCSTPSICFSLTPTLLFGRGR